MRKPVLLDNTVLSNLAVVGQADLVLKSWSDRVLTTPEMLGEYEAAAQAGILPPAAYAKLSVVARTAQERAMSERFSTRLGRGERSCLAVARSRGALFATVDADARAAARRLDGPITGTLGILALAVRLGLLTLTQANGLLADMVRAGYRSPLGQVDDLI
jgi:predicted nucleic acid-binding protein